MRTRTAVLAVAVCLLAYPGHAAGQDDGGAASPAGIAVVVSHPFPDSADPLGFDAMQGVDLHHARHGAGGEALPYPHIMVDGVRTIAGIPDAQRPEASVLGALRDAVAARGALPSPLTLAMQAEDGPAVRVRVSAEPTVPLGRASLWVALTEDHVAFRPPAALSNGVTDHRFTLRAVHQQSIMLDGPTAAQVTFPLEATWRTEHLAVVAWVEADASGSRFAPGEVLQSATLLWDAPERMIVVQQPGRAVLVEMRSATWCDPCLFGDRAVEQVAVDHGRAEPGEAPRAWTYWRPPAQPVIAVLAAGAGAMLVGWLGRRA